MQPLFLLTAVDVRRATQTGTSRALTISKLVIPPIKFVSVSHNPGGGVMGVDYLQPRVEPLEPAMEIKGLDIDVFTGFGERDRWVFAASMRNKKTNLQIPRQSAP